MQGLLNMKTVYKHVKTGHLYHILTDAIDIIVKDKELLPVVVYTRYDQKTCNWCRSAKEFYDGRFIIDKVV